MAHIGNFNAPRKYNDLDSPLCSKLFDAVEKNGEQSATVFCDAKITNSSHIVAKELSRYGNSRDTSPPAASRNLLFN